jgi:3-oxoacyl-[acyl-carrier-protein] synthase III
MQMKRASIVGLGMSVPETVLTNADLEARIETSDEWIVTRTGIHERRIAAPHEATSDFATKAAEAALKTANLSPCDVELIIVATCTPDHPSFPATAMLVQERLGAPKGAAFDISVACAGFAYALDMGAQYIETGRYKTVLVIGAETMSRVVNWTDRTTCILFGDGAGAVVLQAAPEGSDTGILSSYLAADGSGACMLGINAGGTRQPITHELLDAGENLLFMRGKEVFRFGVNAMGDSAAKAIERAGLTEKDINLLIPHQANIRIIKAAAERMGLLDEAGELTNKVMANVDRYGNTSAASVPIAMVEAWETGRIKPGDIVVTIGFGAGLAWGANVIRWGNV